MSAEYPLAIPTMIVPGTKLDSPAHTTIETKQNEEIVAIAGELDTHKNTTLDPHGAMSLTNDILLASSKGLKINEGIPGTALSFDGSTGHLAITNQAVLNSGVYTFECWFKVPDSIPASLALQLLGRTGGPIFAFFGNIPNYGMVNPSFYFFNGTTEYYFSTLGSGIQILPNVWYHVAFCWDKARSSPQFEGFFNGIKVATGDTDATNQPSSSNVCYLARYSTGYSKVIEDEIRLSNVVRYTSNFTPTTTRLTTDASTIFLFHADDGVGTSVVDDSANNFTATLTGAGGTWVTGTVSGANADKYLIKRTSASPATGTGILQIGYTGSNSDTVKISPLGTNGFVKTSGSDGTLGVDTATYLDIDQVTTPQTITGNVVITGEMKSGTAKIGDVANGNYTEIESDGSIHCNGDATAWDDYMIPGTSVRLGATAPDFEPGFNGDSQLYYSSFAGTGLAEYVFFNLQMPHNWKLGTTIYPHVHMCPTSTNAGDTNQRVVRFALEYMWANIDGTFPARATIYLDSDPFVPNTSQWKHLLCKNGTGIDGTGKGLSSMLMCKLVRYGEDSANIDTYPQDVAFLQFDIHYEIDTLGSREEYIK